MTLPKKRKFITRRVVQKRPGSSQQKIFQKWFQSVRDHSVGVTVTSVVAIIGLVASLLGIYSYVKPQVSFDPTVLYDPQNALSEQFGVTNNGSHTIFKIFFTCSLTSLQLTSGQNLIPNDEIISLFPITNDIAVLLPGQKTNVDCSFNSKLGHNLEAANIELEVFFKITPFDIWPFNLAWHESQKFSGIRISNQSNDFVWNYGSPDAGIFEKPYDGKKRNTVIIPYGAPVFPGD